MRLTLIPATEERDLDYCREMYAGGWWSLKTLEEQVEKVLLGEYPDGRGRPPELPPPSPHVTSGGRPIRPPRTADTGRKVIIG